MAINSKKIGHFIKKSGKGMGTGKGTKSILHSKGFYKKIQEVFD